MHPQIEAVLTKVSREYPIPNAVTLRNAERLLNYIDDINVDRPRKFEPTPSQSLYILWNVEDWEFHIECIKNGRVIYFFCKDGYEEASGSDSVDEFIPQLEKYLLKGVG